MGKILLEKFQFRKRKHSNRMHTICFSDSGGLPTETLLDRDTLDRNSLDRDQQQRPLDRDPRKEHGTRE